MELYEFLRTAFTLPYFAKIIERKKAQKSVIFDRVFANRETTPFAMIDIHEIIDVVKSVPVVTRDGKSVTLTTGIRGNQTFEPMPVYINKQLTGKMLNDLKQLLGQENGSSLIQSEIDRITMSLMSSVEKTRNALCAQAITGKIDYQMATDGGYERYKVEYGADSGAILGYDIAEEKKWNQPDVGMGDVLKDLMAIKRKLMSEGSAGTVSFLAGAELFAALTNKITSLPNDQRFGAVVTGEKITVGGYTIELCDGYYNDRDSSGNDVVKPELADDALFAWVEGVPVLMYAAIDDIEGNLQASPFFSRTVKIDDPSGLKIIGESKPFPVVNTKCMLNCSPLSDAPKARVVNTTVVETTYTTAMLTALTKAKILAIATGRGYEMTKTDADTKDAIITEFLTLQTAAQG